MIGVQRRWIFLLILPWVVQTRRNIWIGVAIRAIVNGASFILIALGRL